MNAERPPFFDRETVVPIVALSFAWYLMMFLPDITREVLLGGVDGAGKSNLSVTPLFFLNSIIFLLLTGTLIGCYFYLAPGIKNKVLGFLFCLPWAPVGAGLYIFILGILPFGGSMLQGDNPLEQLRGLGSLMVLVPVLMVMNAWLPIVVLKPVTFRLGMVAGRKRREKWLKETAYQTTSEVDSESSEAELLPDAS